MFYSLTSLVIPTPKHDDVFRRCSSVIERDGALVMQPVRPARKSYCTNWSSTPSSSRWMNPTSAQTQSELRNVEIALAVSFSRWEGAYRP